MKDLFIPQKFALLAMSHGFDEVCIGAIYPDGEVITGQPEFIEIMLKKDSSLIKAPLYDQINDWMERNYGIHTYTVRTSSSWYGKVQLDEAISEEIGDKAIAHSNFYDNSLDARIGNLETAINLIIKINEQRLKNMLKTNI